MIQFIIWKEENAMPKTEGTRFLWTIHKSSIVYDSMTAHSSVKNFTSIGKSITVHNTYVKTVRVTR